MPKILAMIKTKEHFFLWLCLLLSLGLNAQSGKLHAFSKDRFTGYIRLQIGLENGDNLADNNYDPSTIESEVGKVVVFRITSIEKKADGIETAEQSRTINNNFLKNNQVVFPSSCNTSSDQNVLQRVDSQSPSVYRQTNGEVFKMAEIRYRITGFGTTTITLGYTAAKKDEAPSGCEHRTTYTIIIRRSALALDAQWGEIEATGVSGICSYLSREPNGIFAERATRNIKAQIERDWAQTKDQIVETEDKNKRLNIVDRFIKKYEDCPNLNSSALNNATIMKNSLQAELQKIVTPKPKTQTEPPKPTPDITQWEKIKKSRDIVKYQEYLNQFPKGKNIQDAKDSIFSLTPISVSAPEENSDGSITIRFGNLSFPEYNSNGLTVQDEFSDNTLTLTFEKPNGKYDIIVIDKKFPWKRSIQHIDNLFIPKMAQGEDQFTISFQGGVKPYKIELIDTTTQTVVWTKPGIRDSSQVVLLTTLAAEKLYGKLKIRVSDSSAPPSTIEMDYINLKQNNWWILPLVLIVVGGVAAIAFFAYRFSKKKNTNIFNT